MLIWEKIEQTIKKFNLLKSNDRVVVAVSGGPDSVALVYLLNKVKNKWRLSLYLAHLNHMLRKQESEKDSLFVQQLAKRLNLPLACESADVHSFAQKMKLSIEDAARRLRYNFLLKVAKENSADKIALGHNWDDQAETVLMRFLRGSGISGLRGIPPARKLNGCLIIRPLIEIKRSEILDYLSAKNISFRTDSSNLENLYLRNRIRHGLLPFLERDFNPNIKEVLVNFAQNFSEDFDFLQKAGEDKFKTVCTEENNGQVVINGKKFLLLHKALQKFIVRLAIKGLKGNVRKIDFRHWKELEDLVAKRPKDSIVDLPAGLSVVKKGEDLVFYLRKTSLLRHSKRK